MLTKSGLSLDQIISLLPEKFPAIKINYYHITKSLSFFDDAEVEPLPKMHAEIVFMPEGRGC